MLGTLARIEREFNFDAHRYTAIWGDKENDQGLWSWV